MNQMKNSLILPFRKRGISSLNFFNKPNPESIATKNKPDKVIEEPQLINTKNTNNEILLNRTLRFPSKHLKPREVWVENFDEIKEKKRGLIELHPKIFGTMPRLDLIYDNVKWQSLYRNVILYTAKSRAEMRGGGRKPHPQKGLGKARQGSIRSPHMIGGGTAHGPRNPTTYFYLLPTSVRLHGLTSTLSAKFAQDDIHVVDNLDIPTDKEKFVLDLIKERKWGDSVLIVDDTDVMPRNITVATDSISKVTLMPVYGLNVYSMLKHETLVLTVAAVNEIEEKLLNLLYTANPLQVKKDFDSYIKH